MAKIQLFLLLKLSRRDNSSDSTSVLDSKQMGILIFLEGHDEFRNNVAPYTMKTTVFVLRHGQLLLDL